MSITTPAIFVVEEEDDDEDEEDDDEDEEEEPRECGIEEEGSVSVRSITSMGR